MSIIRATPKMRSFIAVGILAVAAVSGFRAAGQTANKDLTVTKADGKQVKVPATGPLANPTAQEVAAGVLYYDKQVKSHPPGRHASPEVARAMQQMADESRNEAVEQLDLTYRVAQETSGPLDSELLEGAKKNVEIVREIMQAPPPPNLNVHTTISASIPNAILHYCLRADYVRKACDWQSYNSGALMPIGRYMFRVESSDGSAKIQEEIILVLNDPTQRIISPMH